MARCHVARAHLFTSGRGSPLACLRRAGSSLLRVRSSLTKFQPHARTFRRTLVSIACSETLAPANFGRSSPTPISYLEPTTRPNIPASYRLPTREAIHCSWWGTQLATRPYSSTSPMASWQRTQLTRLNHSVFGPLKISASLLNPPLFRSANLVRMVAPARRGSMREASPIPTHHLDQSLRQTLADYQDIIRRPKRKTKQFVNRVATGPLRVSCACHGSQEIVGPSNARTIDRNDPCSRADDTNSICSFSRACRASLLL